MLAESFGDGNGPMQFHQEKGGRLISVLAVRPDRANEQSGQGQREFEHHVDFSHSATCNGHPDLDGRPGFVILAGVRSDGTATTYTSVAEVVATALSPEALSILTEPRFETPLPAEMGLGQTTSGPKAVLWKTSAGEWGRPPDRCDLPMLRLLLRWTSFRRPFDATSAGSSYSETRM